MTQNDGGTPYEPKPDPETPPTQPVSESSGAEPAQAGPADPGPGAPSEQGDANAPYGQPGAPGAYGQPAAPAVSQYGHAQSPPKNDLAVWSLITGILSYVFCPLVLGIAAIVTGTMSRKAADQGLANNRGMGTAGLILGWINVALVLVAVVLFIVLLGAGLLSGGFGEWGDMNDMDRYGDY
ncbi:DUF4190 domain-containing protein [Promicromonospora panici]|uniref:DUF4190 domain-containing protein n=1 Tax=Promicromonospora panici TaxID=2219658 RepID=UPI00101CCDEC|nr:DUF4190 domain-containing protein [Promicromonospora panici]